MFLEVSKDQIPKLKNIMAMVTYRNGHSVTDIEVLVYDDFAGDWHNVTREYNVSGKVEELVEVIEVYLAEKSMSGAV